MEGHHMSIESSDIPSRLRAHVELQGASLTAEELSQLGECYPRFRGKEPWDVREYASPAGNGAREYRVVRAAAPRMSIGVMSGATPPPSGRRSTSSSRRTAGPRRASSPPTRSYPPLSGSGSTQNAQFPGAGASIRVGLPAGTKKVATTVASAVPSLRAIPTIPPFSKKVVSAG